MVCNPKEKLQMLKDAVRQEYGELAKMDTSDPEVLTRVENNRRLHNVLKKGSLKEVQDLVNGAVQDQNDPLTRNFKARFAPNGKVSIRVGGNTRNETVKAVEYKKKIDQDYISVSTYPSTRPNDVRVYTFAAGEEIGVVEQLGKDRKTARINGMDEYGTYLRNMSTELGSRKSTGKAMRDTARRVDDYVHGNINHMKRMVEDLSTDPEYADYAKSVLDKMNPKFFKDLELFVGQAAGQQNEGLAGARRLDLYYASKVNKNRNAQSMGEVYLHEVLHTMTMFGYQQDSDKSRALQRELSELVQKAREQITVEDLYPINPTQEEKNIAKELYTYIFNNEKGIKVGDQEFLVHALSNPVLIEKLKTLDVKEEGKSLLDSIVDFFGKLMRILVGDLSWESRNSNMYEHVYNLAYRLGEINNKADRERNRLFKASDAVFDMVRHMDDYAAEKIQLVRDKVVDEESLPAKYPVNGTKAEKAAYMVKFAKYAMTRTEYRKALGILFSEFGLKPTSSVREFVGSFFERNSLEKTIDWLGLAAGKIDTNRESLVNSSRSAILEDFNGELKEYEDEALTRLVLDTNLGVLYKDYKLEGVRKFAESDLNINKELNNLKKELNKLDKENYLWLEGQAHGLGWYMATHKGNIAQNINSYNIAKGFLAPSPVTYNKDVENLVSKIASLTALKYSKKGKGHVLVDLVDRQPEGVRNVINMYEGFKTSAKDSVFAGDPVHIIDGYTTEQFDDNVELKVLPSKEEPKLRSLGFKEVKQLDRIDIDGNKLSLFVSEGYGVKERLRGATKLVSQNAKGTSLKEIIYGNSKVPELEMRVKKKLMDRRRDDLARKIAEGNFDPTNTKDEMLPLLNSRGEVVDYRYTMDKDSKKELLKQDIRVSEVLPRSSGHLLDKVFTARHNQDVLNVIIEDMETNWSGKNKFSTDGNTEYVVLNKNSSNPGHRDMFKMLPKEFRDYAEAQEHKSIAVPASLYHHIFGYDHMSIVHNKYAKHLPKLLNKLTGLMEELWMDLVKVVKGNILMKTPVVLIGNLVSNFMIRVVSGANPFQLFRDYYDSFKDVRHYIKNNREIIRLENRLISEREELKTESSSSLRQSIKSTEDRVARLKQENEQNPVKELVDAGLYQAIVEDVEVSTIEGKTVFNKMGDVVFSKVPFGKYAKTGTDLLYLNQNTKWFKINQEIMQLSDLIARDVQNRSAKVIEKKQVKGQSPLPAWWLREKGWSKNRKLKTKEEVQEFKEASKKVRMYSILENYVNYSRPSGRGEEYLNRMGLLMFTKYAKRIQKVIFDQGTQYPLKTFLSLFIDSYLMDVSNIQDASIFAKAWHSETHGPGNFYPLYSPLENLENFVTPALVKDSTWDFLPI